MRGRRFAFDQHDVETGRSGRGWIVLL